MEKVANQICPRFVRLQCMRANWHDDSQSQMSNIKKLISGDVQGGDYKLNTDVFFVLAPDGSGRLFDIEDFFYAVSPVGSKMLQQALSHDRETAIETLVQLYGVDKDTIRNDYTVLLEDLEKRGLLVRESVSRQIHAQKNGTLSKGLPYLLRLIRIFPLKPRAWLLIALAHLMLSLWGWNKTVYALVQSHRVIEPRSEYGSQSIRLAFRAVAARHLLPINCKERALSAWSLCAMEGIPSSITVGINLFPLSSHCWCGTAEECLSDFTDRCEGFTPLLVYT